MADNTKIEWTDATWNPITGCSIVSPGCANCYAMKLAGTRLKHHPSREGLTRDSKAGPVWTGEVRFNAEWLDQPLRWTKPRMIFVCAHGDLFAEGVPDEWIDQVFAVMALCPQHTFQVLTKRPERMREYLRGERDSRVASRVTDYPIRDKAMMQRMLREIDDAWPVIPEGDPEWPDGLRIRRWPLPNVWLGVSVEDQRRADERIPILLDTPAAIRWISAEPLLGPVDLEPWLHWPSTLVEMQDGSSFGCVECDDRCDHCPKDKAVYRCEVGPSDADGVPAFVTDERMTIDWVVAGGESGQDARPMHPDWARSLRDQCAAAGVPFVFKQWGEWTDGQNVERYRGMIDVADYFDGVWHYGRESLSRTDGHIDDEPEVYRTGKRAAGRLLDGVEHNGYPQVRP